MGKIQENFRENDRKTGMLMPAKVYALKVGRFMDLFHLLRRVRRTEPCQLEKKPFTFKYNIIKYQTNSCRIMAYTITNSKSSTFDIY